MTDAATQRALVTGAGQRIGARLALALAERGYTVAVHYRSSDAGAQATADAIRAAGGHAELVQADLSTPDGRGGLIGEAMEALGGPLSVLVNNASTFVSDDARDFTEDGWDLHFDANLRAPCLLAQHFANALPADADGLIVNLIDQRVWKLNPTFFTYTLSKSALWTATRTLAQALAPNVRVNGIGPGPTLANVHQAEGEFDAEARATLTGKGSHPDEIVRALLYFLDATSVTGQMIAADGGQHLMWQTPDVFVGGS